MAEDSAAPPLVSSSGDPPDTIRHDIRNHQLILDRIRGRRDGWFEAQGMLKEMSGKAYASGKDEQATLLRGTARGMSDHPYTIRLLKEEQETMDYVKRRVTELRLLGLDP